MQSTPLVSVVMPVYNAERFLPAAIESILGQTYRNLECILIDDGSTDSSMKIIERYGALDKRINLLRFESNRGIVHALNSGLRAANGTYVARMDADDISLPDRISKQVSCLERYPELGLLSCNTRFMDVAGNLLGSSVSPFFCEDIWLRWEMLFRCPFTHTGVIFRRSIQDMHGLFYDPMACYAEDYDLWRRMLQVTKCGNISETLCYYRIHSTSITVCHKLEQDRISAEVSALAMWEYLTDTDISFERTRKFSQSLKGISTKSKKKRAELFDVFLTLLDGFSCIHNDSPHMQRIKRKAIGEGMLWTLYPLGQKGSVQAFWRLIKMDWRGILYFAKNISVRIMGKIQVLNRQNIMRKSIGCNPPL